MSKEKILVADDEKQNREFLAEILKSDGFEVKTAENGEKAIGLIEEGDFDLLLTDLKMPGANGIEVLKRMKSKNPDAIGIVFTGFGTIAAAVEAMKAGAYDFITKPFHIDAIRISLSKALELRRLRGENIFLRRQLKEKYKFENIIGDSPEMLEVFKLIEKVADSDSTVIIYGESGTGKELVARAIHFNSSRQDKPLIPVNCGAIPEDLLESELFGHVKGAFTGAFSSRVGRFELAHGGTVFLDEVGDMSPALQVKLLRVLQHHEFEPVGSVKTMKVDVRVLAATHQDLDIAVAEKKFREDLFYRLNVIPVHLPPMRNRRADIPLLVSHFINKFNREKKRNIGGVSQQAMDMLLNYHWPGNVRELENLMERLAILKGKGIVETSDLPHQLKQVRTSDYLPKLQIPQNGINLKKALTDFEKDLIVQALARSDWVKNKAAKLLGLNRTTLVEKLKKMKIEKA